MSDKGTPELTLRKLIHLDLLFTSLKFLQAYLFRFASQFSDRSLIAK
jgi:hypothetical protein